MSILPSALLIDDDTHFSKWVATNLKDIVSLSWVNTIDKAKEFLRVRNFQIILLDFDLGEKNGAELILELLDENRDLAQSRIIMLTASQNDSDLIYANQVNLSETVKKPISKELLRSIVKKHIRQLNDFESGEVHAGKLRLLIDEQMVYFEDSEKFERIGLSRVEFLIMVQLAKNIGIVQTRNRLLDCLTKSVESNDRVIDVHITSIRKAHPYLKEIIKTKRGIGYFLDL